MNALLLNSSLFSNGQNSKLQKAIDQAVDSSKGIGLSAAIIFPDDSIWEMGEMLRFFAEKPLFEKGEDWNYSTTNYVLLRILIQKLSGKSVSEFYAEIFSTKLNMKNSFASHDGNLTGKIAHSCFDLDNDGKYDPFYDWSRNAFASSIGAEVWTTAVDIAYWIKALLDDKRVINKESYNEAVDYYSLCTGEDILAGYGLGICKFNPALVDGLEAIGHAGNALGYGAIGFYLPEYDITVVILDNTEKADAIFHALSKIISINKENYSKVNEIE